MSPMTNSEIEARNAAAKTARTTQSMIDSRRGIKVQVSQQRMLAKSHCLVWSTDGAEIRDDARNGAVVYSSTLADCEAEAIRRGL